MPPASFDETVFVNCPFDERHAPLREAMVFTVINFGLTPRLADESLEGGETRLDKIVDMLRSSRYSIHDLSRCQATQANEYFRMNMPFEFGLDVGLRRSGDSTLATKKFLILEGGRFDLKQALSDTAGQDPEHHNEDWVKAMEKVRHFFHVEARLPAPGLSLLLAQYATFQGWMHEKKRSEGHDDEGIKRLPTRERLTAMQEWVALGRPAAY